MAGGRKSASLEFVVALRAFALTCGSGLYFVNKVMEAEKLGKA